MFSATVFKRLADMLFNPPETATCPIWRCRIPIDVSGGLYPLGKFGVKLADVFAFVFPNRGFYVFADMGVTVAGLFGLPFGFVEILRRSDSMQHICQPQ